MSFEVTTSFVQQYKDNVVQLAQQKGSRLRSCVKVVPNIVGMNYYFERIGATGAVIKTGRHVATPLISTPHSRRRVSMTTVQWGEAIDNDDKLKLLINPESEYVEAAQKVFGRTMDDFIIDGALNNAFSGQDGATSVGFPAAQVIADTAITNLTSLDTGTDDGKHLSPQRMLKVKQLFDLADVDPDEDRYIVVSPKQITDMLSRVSVTSADYNTIKALAEGAVDTYMGFKFVMSNRLPTISSTPFGPFGRDYSGFPGTVTASDRICFAFAMSGIGFALQEDVKTEIAKDPSLSFATRLYMEMVMGSTRIEEARVVAVPVVEA